MENQTIFKGGQTPTTCMPPMVKWIRLLAEGLLTIIGEGYTHQCQDEVIIKTIVIESATVTSMLIVLLHWSATVVEHISMTIFLQTGVRMIMTESSVLNETTAWQSNNKITHLISDSSYTSPSGNTASIIPGMIIIYRESPYTRIDIMICTLTITTSIRMKKELIKGGIMVIPKSGMEVTPITSIMVSRMAVNRA